MRTIPLSVGVLGLSFAAAGCSDAKVVADAFEKVCKADCECPPEGGYAYEWNEERNCKKACRGYGTMFEAQLLDRESEACDDIREIAKDIADCTAKSCGDLRDACVDALVEEFYECWPPDAYYPPGARLPNETMPIDRPLGQKLLYGPYDREIEASADPE